VAGLIQVSREQNIDIVNPIGSGFVDTPALSVWLPSLCRQLLGERAAVGKPPGLVVRQLRWTRPCPGQSGTIDRGPGHGPVGAATVLPAERMAAIRTSPHAFMARDPVCPAVVPAWARTASLHAMRCLRVFVCATRGVCRHARWPGHHRRGCGDLLGDCPERQQSKDIWVLSDHPVEPFSLMGGLQAVAEFRRSSDLPSRVADHLLWLGRYLERAEGRIRLLRSVFRRLSGEARPGDMPELPFLLNLLRKDNICPRFPSMPGPHIPRYRELSANLNAALYDRIDPRA
jgi:hypothetical protein